MTREKAKEFLPIIEAYSEGKTIQYKSKNDVIWNNDSGKKSDLTFSSSYNYRIKPESEYIPFTFEDKELFRDKWIRNKAVGSEMKIDVIHSNNCVRGFGSENGIVTLEHAFNLWEFLDGTPFGKLVE